MKPISVVVLLCCLLPASTSYGYGQNAPQTILPDNPVPNYQPITGKERLHWFVTSTVGPSSLLLIGPLSAGWGTARNSPEEYGPHWDGFGKRYGIRLTGLATGRAIEASLGAALKEDPRYFQSPHRELGARLKHVMWTALAAPGANGRYHPAYARLAGNVGSNFLSNLWRVDSDAGTGDAAVRCALGVARKIASNGLREFWPDVKQRVFGKK